MRDLKPAMSDDLSLLRQSNAVSQSSNTDLAHKTLRSCREHLLGDGEKRQILKWASSRPVEPRVVHPSR